MVKTTQEHQQTLRQLTPKVFLESHYGINGHVLRANERIAANAPIVQAVRALLPEMIAAYNAAPLEVQGSSTITTFAEDLEQDDRVVAGTHRVEWRKEKCGGKGQTVSVPEIVAND